MTAPIFLGLGIFALGYALRYSEGWALLAGVLCVVAAVMLAMKEARKDISRKDHPYGMKVKRGQTPPTTTLRGPINTYGDKE